MAKPEFAQHLLGFDHTGLSVADLDAMSDWYQRTLGMELLHVFEVPERGARSHILGLGSVGGQFGYGVELIQIAGSRPNETIAATPSDRLKTHGYGHIALRVNDLDATFRSLVDAGAASFVPPRESPISGFRSAYVTDPEGNQIEIREFRA